MGSRLGRQGSLEQSRPNRASETGDRTEPAAAGDSAGGGSGGEFLFSSLVLRSEKLPGVLRRSSPSPYQRRVAWVRQIQKLLKEQRVEEAGEALRLLRKDLGLEGSSLNDVLYKNSAFLNMVDPISHELLLSLARDMQCPKREANALKSSDKICRQLVYHLTPHSKWTRQSVPKRKSHACLKTTLKKKLTGDTVDLSGIPLSGRDVQRVVFYLHSYGSSVEAVDLSFTELQDDGLRQLLPALGLLPKLSTLAVNGNRLTTAILKDLTEALKDTKSFPSLAWVDLGNNVDIFTLPQPLLVALRRRYGLRSSLPTIYEYRERQDGPTGLEASTEEDEDEPEPWSTEENAGNITLHFTQR
ncbi:leucine-rich repeat-containing protein 75B-like [Astyanax mexicanus]|uniref:Leucine rich repeat containing 75B n=1 Tax=Astyanax mexicanus TaxID=7994 RepID=A0A8B9LF39_ASTMX|nr:leucine-rich repeat-containing protein 75B-like [Astyanax mexicanus]